MHYSLSHFIHQQNYTCLNGTTLPTVDSQALFKINETFFYVTSWSNKCVYKGIWIPSLFANVTQTVRSSIVGLARLQIDNLQRRWVVAVGFGVVVSDQSGNFLGLWKFGNGAFDIYISNDYRLVVSDYRNSSFI
jgi:hypothetical protein